ncbi:MAG: PHB depolymerase family esterase, partial [Candidatus Saccharibacteria bacterium]|nr:PHB depolymerase family esterase [Pseudorhodobacter sp.]
GPHGSRNYRLYVPANRSARMPLVIMLHGCTQNPEDFAAGTKMNALAEEFGCIIAYPGQQSGANAQKCWNWFRAEDQATGSGEPAIIAGLTRDILRDHPVDPARVYIAGLSAGGAAALIMGCAYPDIFRAIGVHSGLAVGAAQDVPSAFAAMRNGARGHVLTTSLPTIVFHGSADATVKSDNGRAIIDQIIRPFSGVTQGAERVSEAGQRGAKRTIYKSGTARTVAELWEVDGAGHAWSGGSAEGSYTDPTGPDASRQMLRFFLAQVED